MKAQANDINSIRLFNMAGADLNTFNYDLKNMGHIAAIEQNEELLTYLAKDTKFDFDVKDRLDFTPYDEIKDHDLSDRIQKLFVTRRDNITEESGDIIDSPLDEMEVDPQNPEKES